MSKKVRIFRGANEISELQEIYDSALQALELAKAETDRCSTIVSQAKHALETAKKQKRILNGKQLQAQLNARHMNIEREHKRNLEEWLAEEARETEERRAEKARKILKLKQKKVDEHYDPDFLPNAIALTPRETSRGGKLTRKKAKKV